MLVDLEAFAEENFDQKKWINASCKARHPDQSSVEKHLVDLEMKIQIAAEEISASLEDLSASALLRIPRASRDIIRLRDDALSLRSSLSSIILRLKQAEGSSAQSVASIAKIDATKQRMEAAYETLQDAAGLTQLSSTVEDIFSSGDLPRAAETLATMRHCISAVGEVAEFANIRKQLVVLEDRLDAMVQPQLIDALLNHKIDFSQDLRGILVKIGRSKSLELHYTTFHVKSIKKLWQSFDSKKQTKQNVDDDDLKKRASINEFQPLGPAMPFLSWLPSFYHGLLLYLEQEWKWCMAAFPDDYTALVPKLVLGAMNSLGASFISRINLATGSAVSETKSLAKGILDVLSGDVPKGVKIQPKHLETLIDLHNVTGTFVKSFLHLCSESDVQVMFEALKAIYSPFEPFKLRYGHMERAILSSEVARIDLRGAVTRGLGAQGVELSETVRRMEESVPQVILLLEAAVERCLTFTGGSELDELLLALDDVMLQYISALQDTLKSLRTACGVSETARKIELNEEWSIVQGALQILTVTDCLTSRVSVFEASLRATLAQVNTTLAISTPTDGQASLNMVAIRLADSPEKAWKLTNLLNQSNDPRFHALPIASRNVSAFGDAVNELVYDVLVSKVRERLNDVARSPVWEELDNASAATFSSYPQAYVTAIGEYLLTLPQQLDPLADGITDVEDAQLFATEWMFKVAEGAAGLYMEQLRGIQFVSEKGARQLGVDVEYMSNVLSALSIPVPAVLHTYQRCMSTPRDQLRDVIKSDGGSSLDLSTANLVCKMRRISLDH